MGTETPPPAAAWIRPIPNLLTGLRLVLAVALPFAPPAWWLPIVLSAGVTDALDGWIFSGGNPCVKDVIVGGIHVVKDRVHIREEQVAKAFRAAVKRLIA